MDRVGFEVESGGGDEADVGQGIDGEEGEGLLGFSELEVAEEEVGFVRVRVVLDEGGGEEGEFRFQGFEAELGLVMELLGVEEEEEGEGAGRGGGGEEAGDEGVGEVDDAGEGLGLEGEEVGDEVVGGGGEEGEEREEEEERERGGSGGRHCWVFFRSLLRKGRKQGFCFGFGSAMTSDPTSDG